MRLTASDCLDLGIIDRIVPEPRNGAHSDPDEAARMLHRVLVVELAGLQSKSAKKRAKERYAKYRNMGEYSSQIKATIAKEVNAFQNLVKSGMTRISTESLQNRPSKTTQAATATSTAQTTTDPRTSRPPTLERQHAPIGASTAPRTREMLSSCSSVSPMLSRPFSRQ